jgi:hypothetical protein
VAKVHLSLEIRELSNSLDASRVPFFVWLKRFFLVRTTLAGLVAANGSGLYVLLNTRVEYR